MSINEPACFEGSPYLKTFCGNYSKTGWVLLKDFPKAIWKTNKQAPRKRDDQEVIPKCHSAYAGDATKFTLQKIILKWVWSMVRQGTLLLQGFNRDVIQNKKNRETARLLIVTRKNTLNANKHRKNWVSCKTYLQQLLCGIKSSWSTPNNTEMRVYCCSASPSYQILNYTPSAWVKWPSAQHVEAYKIIIPKVICVLAYVLKQALYLKHFDAWKFLSERLWESSFSI